MQSSRSSVKSRRAAIVVWAALLMVLMIGMVAFGVDVGYMTLTRSQLQNAADASAMAAAAVMIRPEQEIVETAREYANYHVAAGDNVLLADDDVQFGVWNVETREFSPTAGKGNAIRVTARRENTGLFFGRVFNRDSFSTSASAVAMANPRDIVFVVDLSGSMNDDSEPAWATEVINEQFAPDGYPTVGSELIQNLFDDFGFGTYPGNNQHVGEPLGVTQDDYAYGRLTKNGGPLTSSSIPSIYRISSGDNENTRKQKAYRWIIEQQIAAAMPGVKPDPTNANYAYWEKYLDYIMTNVRVSNSSSPAAPPNSRGNIPPNQSSDRITGFNNPNRQNYPGASSNLTHPWRNKIGPITYLQFMMDHGRDSRPVGNTYTPFSVQSPDCPMNLQQTAGGSFYFPPRAQPEHAARRALIAAIQVVKEKNQSIPNLSQRDWVSIVTFDKISGGFYPEVVQPLTGDYDAAMLACTTLQTVSDIGASTATETGLIVARDHIKPASQGGAGREMTNKVVVLLTDGVPNLYSSSSKEIRDYVNDNSDWNDFYGASGNYQYNAPLMQTHQMRNDHWFVYPVGLGLGTDYNFMDRLARTGNTASEEGMAFRGSGNPAEYEQVLVDIFTNIINTPRVRLVD